MQVRELPRGGQSCIYGNVVDVPTDVNSTVSVLRSPIKADLHDTNFWHGLLEFWPADFRLHDNYCFRYRAINL